MVVATRYGGRTLRACVERLTRQASARRVEIVVVDASNEGNVFAPESGSRVRVLAVSPDRLVPQLWSAGIQASAAPIVALTIGQCVPDANWIESILAVAARHETCAGFGGSIAGPREGRFRDWAMYFSRYSAYMPPLPTGITEEIAADNAAYRVAALEGCEDARSAFWENLVHQHLRARGWTIMLAGDMRVELGPCPSAWGFCRERYRHGRHFASTRPGTAGSGRFVRMVTAPALAPFLILRIGRRVVERRRDWIARYVLALPWLAVFMTAWALGEAAGYARPRRETP